MVLYSPYYAPNVLLSRLVKRLTPSPSTATTSEPNLSLVEIAAHEGLALGLVKELMEEIEANPIEEGTKEVEGVVRDDQADQASGGVRWYRDLITPWQMG